MDGDGSVNPEEMLSIMVRMHKQNEKNEKMEKAFSMMDKDG